MKRAYSDQEKLAKRQKIIDAAEQLLVKGVFPLPSVNQIIAKAGVAKGTVYLYFTSKEEIYLSLLGQYFDEFTSDFVRQLTLSSPENLIDNFSDGFIRFANERPKATYLASIVLLILENNVSDDYLIGFKVELLKATEAIGAAMANVVNSDQKQEFMTRFLLSYNQFLAYWQHCNPPEHVQQLMHDNQMEGLIFDFEVEFKNQIHRTWNGLI